MDIKQQCEYGFITIGDGTCYDLTKVIERLYPNKSNINVTNAEIQNAVKIHNIIMYHPKDFLDSEKVQSAEIGAWEIEQRKKEHLRQKQNKSPIKCGQRYSDQQIERMDTVNN
jgi:hypothetical protein